MVIVVTPLFDDWDCLPAFLGDLAAQTPLIGPIEVMVVDDGSPTPLPVLPDLPPGIEDLRIVRLATNLGHQRAIAVGLCVAAELDHEGAVVIIDVDGEDRPADIPALLALQRETGAPIVVARRAHRTEAVPFRVFYGLYRRLFRLLTGKRLDFGNFSVLSSEALGRVVRMPELWNHYPSALMRSRLRVVGMSIDRGHRYAGRSRMGFTSLANHGLAAVAAFRDVVLIRLLVTAVALAALTTVAGAIALAWWLSGSSPVAVTVLAGALVLLVQSLVVIAVIAITELGNRSTWQPPPTEFAARFVASESLHTSP